MRVLTVLLAALCACTLRLAGAAECPHGNLLAQAVPTPHAHVMYPERLTDGVLATEGSPWDIKLSSVMKGRPLQFDLGRPVQIRALILQGDHPGSYAVSGSLDGMRWVRMWQSPQAAGRGLRLRDSSALDQVARWIRLEPPRAGTAYVITEIQAYCLVPSPWPPALAVELANADRTLVASPVKYGRHVGGHRMSLGLFGWLVFFAPAGRRSAPT
jgi:hypothetical protein